MQNYSETEFFYIFDLGCFLRSESMKNRKIYLLIIASLLYPYFLYSMPADSTSIIDNIYNFNFLKASDQLSKLKSKDPLMTEALNLEIQWWMALGSQDKDRFSNFLSTLDRFEKTDQNSLDKIISSTYRIRYYACVNKNWMIPLLLINVRKRIEKIDSANLGSTGKEAFELIVMYKSFLSLIQNNIFFERFLPGGYKNRELIGNIEGVILNGASVNKTIGRYFLMKYYLDVEKDKAKALVFLTELHKEYPKNMIFAQLLTN
jgi:hypothetical protein